MQPLLQMILPMGIFILVFYVLIIRPQKKQEREITDMRASVKVGDEIVTIGGIVGKVTRVGDDDLTVEVGADRVKFNFKKWSLREVVNKETEIK